MAIGQPSAPPYELMAYLLAREFGVLPSTIGDEPADTVLRWFQMMADLTPPRKDAHG
jgi:hypothetical protein